MDDQRTNREGGGIISALWVLSGSMLAGSIYSFMNGYLWAAGGFVALSAITAISARYLKEI